MAGHAVRLPEVGSIVARHRCSYLRRALAEVLMAVQNKDGDQEVQGSPRFVRSSARQAELEATVTYLDRATVGESRRGNRRRSHRAGLQCRRLA